MQTISGKTYETDILAFYSIVLGLGYFLSRTNCEPNITKNLRIPGGTPVTDRGQFAYQALLLSNDVGENRPRCGGTIISQDHVLTAAHCIGSSAASSIVVVAGNLYLNDYTILKIVQKIYIHEQFSMKTLHNDIALVKMLEGFGNWTHNVRPINLKTDQTTTGVCVVSGFGTTARGESPMNSKLMYVEASIVDWKTCRDRYTHQAEHQALSVKTICASTTGKDSCTGDSGGPLVCSGKLAGIVSFGPEKCGAEKLPGVYTDVAQYLGWIKQHGGSTPRTAVTEAVTDDFFSPASSTPPSLVLNFMSLLAISIFKIIRNF